MKIYTKTGDTGETSLLGGERRPKSDQRFHAYGGVDELNSLLGVCAAALAESTENAEAQRLKQRLLDMQHHLFDVGSHLACESDSMRGRLPVLDDKIILSLENDIDQWQSRLTPLKNFILPGGHITSGHLHVARAVCRRAERETLQLHGKEPVQNHILVYLNRLSDWLFVAARWSNHLHSSNDVIWKK